MLVEYFVNDTQRKPVSKFANDKDSLELCQSYPAGKYP